MKKHMSLETKTNISGYLFMLPWILGSLFFFIIPFIKSVIYGFSDVSFADGQMNVAWVGLKNFKYMLFVDDSYVKTVVETFKSLIIDVPLIMFFSMFIAMILNQKFVGRAFMRSVFFLPVIIATGMVINIIKSDVFVSNGMDENSAIFQANIVSELLAQMNFSSAISDFLTKATSQIFDLSWKCGLQILLYLSSLQSIPTTYYEVASVEGASVWDSFWRITFPVLSPTSLLIVVYSIIDSFMDYNNAVMKNILDRINNMLYGYASASALIYFAVILIILGVLFLALRKVVVFDNV